MSRRSDPKICNECGKEMTSVESYQLAPDYPGQDKCMKIYKCRDKSCTGYGDRCPVEVEC